MTLSPGTRLGPYEIVAPLGAGGMGEVYRARDTRLGRDVAIKVLPSHLSATPEIRARFEREARTISQLNHPSICVLHDIGHHDGVDYLVMELIEGETLAQRLQRGPLPTTDVLRLGSQIADALDRAHRNGVVHRDLKPGNVMLTKSGAKLMDFGLARAGAPVQGSVAADASPTMSHPLTTEGTILGTLQYMAPEQLEGREADARSDIWALGCVLYEMATGGRAFEGKSQASLIAAILEHEPKPMTELRPMTPPALERVVKRCLEKQPDDRLQSARDLIFALEDVQEREQPIVGGPPSGSRFGARTIVAAVVVGALLTATVAILLPRTGRSTDPSKVTYTQVTFQRGWVSSARFAPDGNSILYSAMWNGQPPEVFETRLGSSTSRSLGLTNWRLLSVSPDGRLAVQMSQDRSNDPYIVGMLAESPLSGGAPREILNGVMKADWSPDGKTMAIVRRVEGRARLEMPPGHVLYETNGEIPQVRVAPDGRHIAIVENPLISDTRGWVSILDATGNRLCRARDEWNYVSGLAWTPDSREAWSALGQNPGMTEIRAIDPSGRERVVTRVPGSMSLEDIGPDGRLLLYQETQHKGIRGRRSPLDVERELGWYDQPYARDVSQDGRTLLFEESGVYGGSLYAVCVRGMDGSPPVRLGEGSARSLSPDGRWALALHFGPPQRLILYPTGAGDSTSFPRGPVEAYFDAGWLPDGSGIVLVASERGQAQRTYVQDLQGGLPQAVSPEGIGGFRVSPDGKFIAGESRDGRLHLVPLNGDSTRFIAQLERRERVLEWTKDGRSVFVGVPGPNKMIVSTIDVMSGRRSYWRSFGPPDSTDVQAAIVRLAPGGQSYAYTYWKGSGALYLVEGLK